MAAIVGLGNPGSKYERTRHNAGFWAIDRFAERCLPATSWKERSGCLYQRTSFNEHDLVLVKPQLFMNRSGEALQGLIRFFQIPLSEILVIHDDLDLDSGVLRVRFGGSAGGHNGVSDIITHCGGADFARLKIGIGHPRRIFESSEADVSSWVLSAPGKEERELLDQSLERTGAVLEAWVKSGLEVAQRCCGKETKVQKE